MVSRLVFLCLCVCSKTCCILPFPIFCSWGRSVIWSFRFVILLFFRAVYCLIGISSFPFFFYLNFLQGRVLATTRNLEIFGAASGKVLTLGVEPNGFSQPELFNFVASASNLNAQQYPGFSDLIKRLHLITRGLPALVSMVVAMSRNSYERFIFFKQYNFVVAD